MAAGLQGLDRCTGRDPAHHGHGDRPLTIAFSRGAAAPDLAERALDDARGKAAAAAAISGKLRQLDDLDRAGAVGQPADEAALFKRGNQPVDARLRAQVQRILHLVEGGRYTGLFQPFIDETQKFVLFAREHLEQVPRLMVPFDSETSEPKNREPMAPTQMTPK